MFEHEIRVSDYGFFALSFYFDAGFTDDSDLSLTCVEMGEWVQENIGIYRHDWFLGINCIQFKEKSSAMAFKLMFPEACE